MSERGAILVLGSDAAIRLLIVECLMDDGYTVHSSPDGLSSAAVVAADGLGLVLVDVDLPAVDERYLRNLRATIAAPVPIIVLTTEPLPAGLTLPNVVALRKPFVVQHLLERVAQVVREAGSRRPSPPSSDPLACLGGQAGLRLRSNQRPIAPPVVHLARPSHQLRRRPGRAAPAGRRPARPINWRAVSRHGARRRRVLIRTHDRWLRMASGVRQVAQDTNDTHALVTRFRQQVAMQHTEIAATGARVLALAGEIRAFRASVKAQRERVNALLREIDHLRAVSPAGGEARDQTSCR